MKIAATALRLAGLLHELWQAGSITRRTEQGARPRRLPGTASRHNMEKKKKASMMEAFCDVLVMNTIYAGEKHG